MLFANTKACFSPAVPRALRVAWVRNGGALTHTARDFATADLLFCANTEDPWLPELLARARIVLHAAYIHAALAACFRIPVAKYVLDDLFDPDAIAQPISASAGKDRAKRSPSASPSPRPRPRPRKTARRVFSPDDTLVDPPASSSPAHGPSPAHAPQPADTNIFRPIATRAQVPLAPAQASSPVTTPRLAPALSPTSAHTAFWHAIRAQAPCAVSVSALLALPRIHAVPLADMGPALRVIKKRAQITRIS